MSGGKSACISRGTLSVLYFHKSRIPLTVETLRRCSFFCQAVRCGSPPSVSQSASCDDAGDWANGRTGAKVQIARAASAMFRFTFDIAFTSGLIAPGAISKLDPEQFSK